MTLYLKTLGCTAIDTPEGNIALATREAALLAYLVRKPLARALRSELASLFWPGTTEKKARHSLSQLIYALRNRVPHLPLVSSHEHITLSGIDADFLAVRRDVAAGNDASALARYNGRFLSHQDAIAETLRDWCDEIDEEIAITVSELLQEQSCVCSATELPRIIHVCEQILESHPHLIGAQIALIEATVRSGHLTLARRIYERLSRSDVGCTSSLPPMSSFEVRRAVPPDTHSVPFSGRDSELKCLLGNWQQTLSGEGKVVVVLGEPGIGKTRLADQFLRRVAIRGGRVWITTCCAATQRLTYTVISDLVRNNVEAESPLMRALSSRAEGAHGLRSESSPDEYRNWLTESVTTHVIAESSRQPLAILIDDAQWADEYTALLIAYWAYKLRSQRVMLVLTVRTQEAEAPPDWIMSDLGRPVRLPVGRISVAAAETMVSAFEHNHGLEIEREVRDSILWQSSGRPFLLLEALASLVTDGGPPRTKSTMLSEPAESLLSRRFRCLPANAGGVVGLLAVWGRPMPETTLRSMCDLGEDDYAEALNVLHARGIAQLQGGLVAFAHDLMRETAYRSVQPGTRLLYHRRTALQLLKSNAPLGLIAQQYAHSGDSDAAGKYSIQAADDAVASHLYSEFEYYCQLCIEQGSNEFRRQAAIKLVRYLVQFGRSSEVENLLPFLDESDAECRLFMSVSRLERDLASGDKSVTDLLNFARRIVVEANSVEDPIGASLAATLYCMALDACAGEIDSTEIAEVTTPFSAPRSESELHMSSIVSVWHGVTRGVDSALARFKEAGFDSPDVTGSPSARAACLYAEGTLLLLGGMVRCARDKFDSALLLAQGCGDLRRQQSIYVNNGVAMMEAGEMSGSRHSLEKAATTTNPHFRIRCYTNLAMLHYEEGNLPLAAQAAEAVLSMNAAYRSPSLESTGRALLGLISLRQGNHEAARTHASSIDGHEWYSLSDASYPATLLSRIMQLEGRKDAALQLIAKTIERTKHRDVLCAMRLQCEQANMLIHAESDAAYRIARSVERRASEGGAYHLECRASDILTQLKTSPR